MEFFLLEECCEILNSKRIPITEKDRKRGIYPYYGANGVQDYVDDYIFDDELVLLAEDGGHFGSKDKPIAYRVSGKCWVNNHAHVLKPKDMLNVDYLCYSIMFYDVSNLICGTTRAKLNQAAMRKMIIPLPPLATQKKIADTLDRAKVLIEKRKAQIEKLDLLVKSQFVEMFGDPVVNPKGWENGTINDICSTIVDCPHSTPEFLQEDTGFMCMRTSRLKPNQIDWERVEYISYEQYVERTKRYVPQRDDIVYSREGAILGVAAIIDKSYKVALGQRMMLLSINTKICIPQYVCYVLNSKSVGNQVKQRVIGSASPRINVAEVKAFNICLPPLALQAQFATFVGRVESQKARLKKSLALLELNYKSLMQKCFKGEMV